MIITLLLQIRNEQTSGHLARFLEWNQTVYDNFVAYDDASDDDTVKSLLDAGVEVIQGRFSVFRSELHIKELLLSRALEIFPETDWFLWLDADELLLESRQVIDQLLITAKSSGYDGIRLRLVNLWRSEWYFRTDAGFNDLTNVRFWRNTGKLHFKRRPGLHLPLHPQGLKKVLFLQSPRVLHFGFSSDDLILRKFHQYQELGQRSRNLWRLVDESTLNLASMSSYGDKFGGRVQDFLASLTVTKRDFTTADPLFISCYYTLKNQKNSHHPKLTILAFPLEGSQHFKSYHSELLKLQREVGEHEIEIMYIVSERNFQALRFLQSNSIDFLVVPHTEYLSNDLNDLYRVWNRIRTSIHSEFILYTRSDFIFSDGFLVQTLKHIVPSLVIACHSFSPSRFGQKLISCLSELGQRFLRLCYPWNSRILTLLRSTTKVSTPIVFPKAFLDSKVLDSTSVNFACLCSTDGLVSESVFTIPDDQAAILIMPKSSKEAKNFNSIADASDLCLYANSSYASILGTVGESDGYLTPSMVRMITSLEDFKDCRKILLLTDNLDESLMFVETYGVERISTCITSNVEIITQLAIRFDVHCYFINNQDKQVTSHFHAILQKIVAQEVKQAFFLSNSESFKTKVIKKIPQFIRPGIKKLRHLFRPQ